MHSMQLLPKVVLCQLSCVVLAAELHVEEWHVRVFKIKSSRRAVIISGNSVVYHADTPTNFVLHQPRKK